MAPVRALVADTADRRVRVPDSTVLFQTVQIYLDSFLRARRTPPSFIQAEFHRYLKCGLLEEGFIRVYCGACRHERLVAFSCKTRGFCPSCGGRRMNQTAAHLVDRVIPPAPTRQWVVSFPYSIRYKMAYKPKVVTKLLNLFLQEVQRFYRQKAKKLGYVKPKTGSITFVQRFGSALNLNVHFHTVFLDGVYARRSRDRLYHFVPVTPPTNEDLAEILLRIRDKILSDLHHDNRSDELSIEEPDLLYCRTLLCKTIKYHLNNLGNFGHVRSVTKRQRGFVFCVEELFSNLTQ